MTRLLKMPMRMMAVMIRDDDNEGTEDHELESEMTFCPMICA